MTTVQTAATDALAPVRRALAAQARRDAERIRAAAAAKAAATVAEADRAAEALLAQARADGETDGDLLVAAERSRARRDARAVVLAAQREVYDELRARVRAAATELRRDPGYPALRAQLARQARAVLGAGADIQDHPEGGVVGTAPGRRVVYSLPDLAEQQLTALGDAVSGVWAP
ncbi:V-type ATP synthase subunit E family protein [Rhodococcus sp. AG1013]|uniref:V-type ATP synthase subunit E family protein n=1 Tax=unclassified Rhodococcus (in: high G+C Gram-positive bacteria) TaxID=192944 RepID=UPI000E2B27F9|nr:V-type ATP synthase subunit E family protein [Rhodococcus sp. AG1013]RDI23215.1 ATP synthase E subunit [Rhodococcus sp. AG1013]